MLMKKMYVLFVTVLLFSVADQAMELPVVQLPIINTYKGVEINAMNLGGLGPQMPSLLQEQAKAWIAQDSALIASLTQFPSDSAVIPVLSEFPLTAENKKIGNDACTKLKNENNALLKQSDIQDMSDYNYAFELFSSHHRYWVKIAGAINKLINLRTYCEKLKKKQSEPITAEQALEIFKTVSTYQTVSSRAHYLVSQQGIESEGLRYFKVPATFVMPIKLVGNAGFTDANSIVLQEALEPDVVTLSKNQDRVKDISEQAIKDCVRAVVLGGLWGLDKNLQINRNNELLLCDLEQPNINTPDMFFHKDRARYEHTVLQGLSDFARILSSDPKKVTLLKQFVREDKDVAFFTHEWAKNLDQFLDKAVQDALNKKAVK